MGSTQDGDGGESATTATLHFLETGPGSRGKTWLLGEALEGTFVQ